MDFKVYNILTTSKENIYQYFIAINYIASKKYHFIIFIILNLSIYFFYIFSNSYSHSYYWIFTTSWK